MLKAIYSKNNKSKLLAISLQEIAIKDCEVLHLNPKNSNPLNQKFNCFCYEDIGKTKTWLAINNLIEQKKIKVLVLDNPSRYAKVTSNKVNRIQKLCSKIENRIILDIVPFTLDIKYIYTPFSYLDRAILGYPHYYAFRENYAEEYPGGKIRHAHDYDLISEKIISYCNLDYDYFFIKNRKYIYFSNSETESKLYHKNRDDLFSQNLKGNVIATKLADIVHAFNSRRDIVLELILSLKGEIMILFNLASYARKFKTECNKIGLKNVNCTSYSLGSGLDYKGIDNIIYMEYPIVKSYFLLDIESKLQLNCNIFHVRSNAKVDIYLENKLKKEVKQISDFIGELVAYLKQKNKFKPAEIIQLNLFEDF